MAIIGSNFRKVPASYLQISLLIATPHGLNLALIPLLSGRYRSCLTLRSAKNLSHDLRPWERLRKNEASLKSSKVCTSVAIQPCLFQQRATGIPLLRKLEGKSATFILAS